MAIQTETRLFPQIHGRTNPLKRLAAAVISQAISDATRHIGKDKKSASNWLLRDDDGFPFWCQVLGMDPGQIRQEVSDLLSSPMNRRYYGFQSPLQPAPEAQGTLSANL